tara:strand:+ start:46 stop:579 length:534 start_codon:yes stop_codon:yes gene_type:complete
MRINFDRLSKLAGLPASGNRRGLNEGAGHHHEGEMGDHTPVDEMRDMDEMEEMDELPVDEGMRDMDEMEEMYHEMDELPVDEEDLDEMIEIDEVMLVQELRRAKRIMQENKRRRLNESRRRNIFEAQLKQVIDEEVQNVMDEMNLTSQWVYGNRRPTRSRKGYTNQGSIMPGFGFKR